MAKKISGHLTNMCSIPQTVATKFVNTFFFLAFINCFNNYSNYCKVCISHLIDRYNRMDYINQMSGKF